MNRVFQAHMRTNICMHSKALNLSPLPSPPPSSGLPDLLDGLAVYTQRHLSRLDRLVRSTYLLDYTLASMKVRGS